jgi:hypothetical protein
MGCRPRVVRWLGVNVPGDLASVTSESHPEDGGSRLHQNMGAYVARYAALRPRNIDCHGDIIWYLGTVLKFCWLVEVKKRAVSEKSL